MAAPKTNDFYIRFNTSDFITATLGLTPQQLGIYIKLYSIYWSAKRVLPSDLAKLSRIGQFSPEHQADLEAVLAEFFVLSEDRTAYRHSELDAQAADNQDKRERAVRNGKKGAAVKQANKEADQQAELAEEADGF